MRITQHKAGISAPMTQDARLDILLCQISLEKGVAPDEQHRCNRSEITNGLYN